MWPLDPGAVGAGASWRPGSGYSHLRGAPSARTLQHQKPLDLERSGGPLGLGTSWGLLDLETEVSWGSVDLVLEVSWEVLVFLAF